MNVLEFIGVCVRLSRSATGDTQVTWAANGEIFALSYDHTVVLRSKVGMPMKGEVRFGAADFESERCWMEEGEVVFDVSENDNAATVRAVGHPLEAKAFRSLWKRLLESEYTGIPFATVDRSLIVEDLAHVELVVYDNGAYRMIQRDPYSGKISIFDRGEIPDEEGVAMGMKTGDFLAVLSLLRGSPTIPINVFKSPDAGYFHISTDDASVLLGGCLYDSVGKLSIIS